MTTNLHIFDRYNWDAKKETKIGGFLPIADKDMALLHQVGIAKEYNIIGSSSDVMVEWKYSDGSPDVKNVNVIQDVQRR